MSQGSKKHISSKFVVVILLICVVCTTIAFFGSVVCYICRKDRFTVKAPMLSSDKETSCNSTTNLISHRTSSVPEIKVTINSPISHITGKQFYFLTVIIVMKSIFLNLFECTCKT